MKFSTKTHRQGTNFWLAPIRSALALAAATASAIFMAPASNAQTEQTVEISSNKCVPIAFAAAIPSGTSKITFKLPDQNCEFIEYSSGDVTPTVKLGLTGAKEFRSLVNPRQFDATSVPTGADKLYVNISVRNAGSSDAFGYAGSGTVELAP